MLVGIYWGSLLIEGCFNGIFFGYLLIIYVEALLVELLYFLSMGVAIYAIFFEGVLIELLLIGEFCTFGSVLVSGLFGGFGLLIELVC